MSTADADSVLLRDPLAWNASSKKFMLKSNCESTILLVTVMRMLEEQYARMLTVAELAMVLPWGFGAVMVR